MLRSLPVQRKLPPSQIPYLTDFRNWGSTSSLLVEHFDRGGNHPDYRRDRHPQSAAVEGGSRRGRSLGAVLPESETIENIAPVPLRFDPGPHSPQQPNYFFFESAMAGLLTCLSNSACSEGEQSISRRSKSAGCKRRGNLLRAFQGFVYIVGSMIVSVSSRMSWLTRWNRSSTRKSPLCGRPTLSIQVLASSPTVWTTNVVSSSHLPIE